MLSRRRTSSSRTSRKIESRSCERICGDRRISRDLMPVGLFAARLVVGRDGEDAGRSQAQGGGERRREADAAVAVPGAGQTHGREEERQRAGGHDVLDGQPGVLAAALRLGERDDRVALHPGDRLAGHVVERRHRDRPDLPQLQVAFDPDQLAVHRRGGVADRLAQRLGVEESPQLWADEAVAGGKPGRPAAPFQDVAGERRWIGLEDVLDLEPAPEPGEAWAASAVLPGCAARKAALMAPAETPAMIGKRMSGRWRRHAAQHADLIGRPRAAAGEDDREILAGRSRVRCFEMPAPGCPCPFILSEERRDWSPHVQHAMIAGMKTLLTLVLFVIVSVDGGVCCSSIRASSTSPRAARTTASSAGCSKPRRSIRSSGG